jgi:hypothetical protein
MKGRFFITTLFIKGRLVTNFAIATCFGVCIFLPLFPKIN